MTRRYPGLLVAVVAVITTVGSIPAGTALDTEKESGGSVGGSTDSYGVDTTSSAHAEMLAGDCIPHPPIQVRGDEDFKSPTSGVANPGAAGTKEDPFILGGWCIPGVPEVDDRKTSLAGISIEATTSHVIVRDNVIGEHTIGLELVSVENSTLENNRILDSREIGVSLESSSQNVVRENTIMDAGWMGLDLEFSDENMLEGNTVRYAGIYGVTLGTSDENVVKDNTLLNNGWGVVLGSSPFDEGSSGNAVLENHIVGNGAHGVVLRSHSGENTVHDNTIRNNGGSGVMLGRNAGGGMDSGQGNVIHDNDIQSNGWYGVTLERLEEENVVRDNTIKGNTLSGVQLLSSSATVVDGNTIQDNLGSGVVIKDESDANRVRENTIVGNDWHGVRIQDQSDQNLVHDNTITGNEQAGVELIGDSRDNEIRDNIIAHQGADGILLSSLVGGPPAGSIVEGNNIHDNDEHGLNAKAHEDLVDSTGNWWGHDTGPSGGVEDACTGEVADGEGESIRTDEAGVCFHSWLAESNLDAGAE